MEKPLTPGDYRSLAELRYQIRRFLNFSEQAARDAGLEPHQHQLMLALKGLPEGVRPRIGECGAAAGMSATFNTPIAGVILAIELLLFEFKSRSFIPLVIASTLATAVHMQLLGAGPMFIVSSMDFGIPRTLPFYLILGGVCGLAAVGFSRWLYWIEDQFEKLPIDELWWPARRTWTRNYWLLCATSSRRRIRHDQRHFEREPRAQASDHCDDRKGGCARSLAGSGASGGCAHAGGYVSNRTMKPMCCIRLWWRKPWIAMFQLCPQACELESWQSALQHMIRW
jgi:voltage-gated chloride channel